MNIDLGTIIAFIKQAEQVQFEGVTFTEEEKEKIVKYLDLLFGGMAIVHQEREQERIKG